LAFDCKFIKSKATSIDQITLFFQFRVWLHIKHCIIENIARPEIIKKKSHEKAAPLRTLVGLIFKRKQKLPYSQLNRASSKAQMGIKLFKQGTLQDCFYFFNLLLVCP